MPEEQLLMHNSMSTRMALYQTQKQPDTSKFEKNAVIKSTLKSAATKKTGALSSLIAFKT